MAHGDACPLRGGQEGGVQGRSCSGCSAARNGHFLWPLHPVQAAGPLGAALCGFEGKPQRQGTSQLMPHVSPVAPPTLRLLGGGGTLLSQHSGSGRALCPAQAADWLRSVGKRERLRPHRPTLHKGATSTRPAAATSSGHPPAPRVPAHAPGGAPGSAPCPPPSADRLGSDAAIVQGARGGPINVWRMPLVTSLLSLLFEKFARR